MRPSHFFFLMIIFFFLLDTGLYLSSQELLKQRDGNKKVTNILSSSLGLTDLCVSTEARYTRHPSISDPLSPFMDHPGAIEHFPSGSFWAVPDQIAGSHGWREN